MSVEDDDARLVAYIDRQLDVADRAALERRLAEDPVLRERLARLQDGDRPFADAFQVLRDAAPVGRGRASLAAIESAGRPVASVRPPRLLRLRSLAAAA